MAEGRVVVILERILVWEPKSLRFKSYFYILTSVLQGGVSKKVYSAQFSLSK